MTGHDYRGFKDWKLMDGIVYLSFIEPKTQKEAVEMVYQEDYDKVGMRPFREARKRLIQQGYLKSDGSMRNAVFKSSMKAFVDQVEQNLEEEERELSDDFRNDIYMITDSDWFRKFFSSDNIEKLSWVGRNEKGRLDYSGAGSYSMKVIGQVLRDFWGIGYHAEHRIYPRTDNIDLNQYSSFDDYVNEDRDFFVEKLEKRFSNELTKEEVFDIVSKGHNIEERFEWRTQVLEELFKRNLFNRLPEAPFKLREAIPGRTHSYQSPMSCDLAKKLRVLYQTEKENPVIEDRYFEEDYNEAFLYLYQKIFRDMKFLTDKEVSEVVYVSLESIEGDMNIENIEESLRDSELSEKKVQRILEDLPA
jgi:hypothetical protein